VKESLMACNATIHRKRLPVSSDGTPNASALFIPFYRGTCGDVASVRLHYFMTGSTGSLRVCPTIRYSNDGLDWDTPTTYGSYATTENAWVYGASYQSTSTSKRYFEIGVTARNTAGVTGPMTMATVDAEIELRGR